MIKLEKTLVYHKRIAHLLVDYRKYNDMITKEIFFITTVDWKVNWEKQKEKISDNEFKKKLFF